MPVRLGSPSDFVTLSVGENHTCGHTQDGELHCWGLNDSAQLGDGTIASKPTPTATQECW